MDKSRPICCFFLIHGVKSKQESRPVVRKPRDAAAVLFGLKFADNIHYKFKSSQASKTMLHSSKHTGAKQYLTQNGHSRSFKVTCFGVSGKAISEEVAITYTGRRSAAVKRTTMVRCHMPVGHITLAWVLASTDTFPAIFVQ